MGARRRTRFRVSFFLRASEIRPRLTVFHQCPESPHMRHDTVRLLSKSFSPAELEYLRTISEFKEAAAMMKSLDDFEYVAFLAHKLLSSANPPIRAAGAESSRAPED
jgi:hypothetical protein